MTRERGRYWLRKTGKALVEVVIVIVGVYVAFLLNEWRADRVDRRTQRQLYRALQEEVHDVDANIEELRASYGEEFSRFEKAYQEGQRPAPEPVYFSIAFEPHLFEAATEGAEFELLDVSLMYDLAEFYNSLDWGLAQLQRLEAFSKDRPALIAGAGADRFYNEQGKLKKNWRWYRVYNRRLLRLMRKTDLQADSLERRLNEHVEALGR